MADRIVVLRSHDPLSFVADTCAALADGVNEPHVWSPAEILTPVADIVDRLHGLLASEPALH